MKVKVILRINNVDTLSHMDRTNKQSWQSELIELVSQRTGFVTKRLDARSSVNDNASIEFERINSSGDIVTLMIWTNEISQVWLKCSIIFDCL